MLRLARPADPPHPPAQYGGRAGEGVSSAEVGALEHSVALVRSLTAAASDAIGRRPGLSDVRAELEEFLEALLDANAKLQEARARLHELQVRLRKGGRRRHGIYARFYGV